MKQVPNDEVIREMTELAAKHDVTMTEMGNGHFHLRGKVLVNYWPFSKNRSLHVQDGGKGLVHCTPEDAVRIACQMTPTQWGVHGSAVRRAGQPEAKPVVGDAPW